MLDPLLSQTAWSMLSYSAHIFSSLLDPRLANLLPDATIAQKGNSSSTRWNPLSVPTYNPPSNFADQLSDTNSPIFIDKNVPNTLFMLPPNVTTGIPAFAAAVGLHPADLFSTTLVLFLGICAAAVVFSAIVWGIATVMGTRSANFRSTSKDLLDSVTQNPPIVDENRSQNGHFVSRSPKFGPSRWRLRTRFSSFHGCVLQGNLVRVLVLFHFPVTIFSCYQMTMGRAHASLVSIILAAISFCFLSVLIPAVLLVRLYITNTSKLYDETWTLLAMGPLYNHYRHGSELFACLLFATNLAFGITIGCGQQNGTVQAIVILVIEVVSALGTSFWLPWGQGASMGLISFLFCVARIVIAVLMVILAPIVSVILFVDRLLLNQLF
jgi:Transient receptor potential (TRP) ion channel